MTLRVVLAEDNYLVREGVASLLGTIEGVDLVAAVPETQSLLKAVRELRPDAVITDIRMPPTHTTEGIEAAKRIRAEFPGTGVVVLSQYVESDYAFELLADGVAGLGYLLKESVSDVDELVRALHDVVRGGSALDAKVVERLVTRTAAVAQSPINGLTERERAVLEAMSTGRSNLAISRTLFMSERAVEKHIGSVFQKLGLAEERDTNRRVMAVLAYVQATG